MTAAAPTAVEIRSDVSPERAIVATLFVAGGVAWTLAAVAGGEDGTTRFVVAEVLWLISHLVLLAATVGLWRLGLHRPGRLAAVGFGLSVFGRVVFAVAEVVALAVDETQDVLLPIAAMLTAVGTLVIGGSILRAGRWMGPWRFAPLATGIYPFVAMFPFAATDVDGPPPASLVGWGIITIAIGWGLSRLTEPPPRTILAPSRRRTPDPPQTQLKRR